MPEQRPPRKAPPDHTREVYRYFFGAYPRSTVWMVLLMTFAGVAEGLGVVTLAPLLGLAEQSAEPQGRLETAVDVAFRAVGLEPTLEILLGVMVLAITTKAVLLLLAQRQVGYTVARVVRDLRLELIRSLLAVRWSYFGTRGPGLFANSVTSEALRAAAAYQEACAVIAGVLQMLAYIVVATLLSPWVAVTTLVVAVVLTLIGGHLVAMTRDSGREQTDASKNLSTRLVDVLQGVKPLKAMAREELVWPLLSEEIEKLNVAKRKEVVAQHTLHAFQEPILTLMLALGLYAALTLTQESLSSVLLLAFIFYRLVTHINTLHMRYQFMVIGESAFFSLKAELDHARSERESPGGSRIFQRLEREIQLEDLTFSYGEASVLDHLNLTIPAGSFVAVYGASGSGKTTLADLIVGLHRPRSGRITIDGITLAEFDVGSWRRSIGYVPQEMLLFNDSVLNNVTLGDPSLTRDDARRALELAGAWEFVSALPHGLDHPIGDRGGLLSGGQRQRISIARALVVKPALIILDEVTAALDPATEAEICRTLQGLTPKVTILAISHQMAMREAATVVYDLMDYRLKPVTSPEFA